MNNRKRVTLTFEIDDRDGYNDEAFLRWDFLQELSCCVNDPYEDTFVMKVGAAEFVNKGTAIEPDYVCRLCGARLLDYVEASEWVWCTDQPPKFCPGCGRPWKE